MHPSKKTQPLKIRVPAPPPTSPPAMNIKQVNKEIGTITQNQRDLIEALRATVNAYERQAEKHSELVSAHSELARSQADLNAKLDNLVGKLGGWIETLQAASGFWKVTEFIGKVFKVLLAITAGAGAVWLFIKGGAPAVQNSDLLK